MKVSVAITCYNYGRFLAGCLNSVLAQTWTDFDIVVVDDGSIDNTPEVIRPFLADPRVKYHRQSNQGPAAAKNMAIRLSDGELVAFLDADDQWEPSKLAEQIPLLANPAVGVIYSATSLIDPDGREMQYADPANYWTYRRGHVTGWLAFDNFVPFSSAVVRRSLLNSHGLFDERLQMGTDWDLWLRLSCVTEFDFVPSRLLRYRRGHANQMSRNWDGRIAAADVIFERFIDSHPNVLSPDELKALRLYNACSRAAGYRRSNLRRSTAWLLKAIRMAPFSPTPYLGLLRNVTVLLKQIGIGGLA